MKTLPMDEQTLRDIIKEHPTPFHLYDEKGIVDNLNRLKKAFSWNEGFREYFAVKALPNPIILKILHDNGCGTDCSSMTELMLSDAMGITGDDIMFSSNETPAEEYIYARKLNAIINLDDITHIDFLRNNGGIPDTICLRYNPGGEFKLGNTIMGNPGEAKYGFTREQLNEGVKRLKEIGVKSFGLHAFLASNTTDSAYYPNLARLLFETAVELSKDFSINMDFINLSGGIGIPYLPDKQPADIEWIGAEVKKAYDETIKKENMKVKIYTELGRYITGPYGYLITTALHKKETYKNYIGLDACAANLMRPAMYGSYHHITVLGKENEPLNHVYDIVGSLCENNDKFAIDRKMPKVEIGDILIMHDTGAHGFAMGYNYNGKLRSSEILYKQDGTAQMIRRAETAKDYFSTLDFLNLNL